jgi:hypothetical protein
MLVVGVTGRARRKRNACNEKARDAAGLGILWLPDLDSNQGPAD